MLSATLLFVETAARRSSVSRRLIPAFNHHISPSSLRPLLRTVPKLFSTSNDLDSLLTDIEVPSPVISIPSSNSPASTSGSEAKSGPSKLIKDDPLVSKQCKNVLAKKGITEFTDIQRQALVPVFEGRDMIARSRTGTVSI